MHYNIYFSANISDREPRICLQGMQTYILNIIPFKKTVN